MRSIHVWEPVRRCDTHLVVFRTAIRVRVVVSARAADAFGHSQDFGVGPKNSDGTRVTSICAAGYRGVACSQCQSDYYQSGQRCFSCGSSEGDIQQLRFLISAAVIIFVALTIAVAMLSSRYLALVVSSLIALQQFVVIGKSAVQSLPESMDWITQLIGFLSVVNFDVQMVKPGCIVPQLTFLSLYWTTIVLVLVCAVLFLLGAALRATWVYHFRLKKNVRRVSSVYIQSKPAAAKKQKPAHGGGVSQSIELSGAPGGDLMNTTSIQVADDRVIQSDRLLPGNTDERDWADTWFEVFSARAVQSLLILGTLM